MFIDNDSRIASCVQYACGYTATTTCKTNIVQSLDSRHKLNCYYQMYRTNKKKSLMLIKSIKVYVQNKHPLCLVKKVKQSLSNIGDLEKKTNVNE